LTLQIAKRYINRNVFSINCSRPNTGDTTVMSENEGVDQNSFLLASSNHGGKPMKNETSFRLTGVRRNSLFERTTPSANFRRHKNSSLATLASVLAHSDNRAYLASCLRHFAQIPRFARNFRYAQPLYAIVEEGQVWREFV